MSRRQKDEGIDNRDITGGASFCKPKVQPWILRIAQENIETNAKWAAQFECQI